MHARNVAILILATFTICTVASATTPADVRALFAKASKAPQPNLRFSDGTTTWIDGSVVHKLTSGRAVIVKATHLALDTDGAPEALRKCDRTANPQTALHRANHNPIDSNATPYIVLPKCSSKFNEKCMQNPPHVQLGLQKGDLAIVVNGNKAAYAIAADFGPEKKFGEGSIALHRQLGHEVVRKVKASTTCALKDVDLEGDTYIVIFPHSNSTSLSNSAISSRGSALWSALLAEEGLEPPAP